MVEGETNFNFKNRQGIPISAFSDCFEIDLLTKLNQSERLLGVLLETSC